MYNSLKNEHAPAVYFPHDCNMSNLPNWDALMLAHGHLGTGIYWHLLELLRTKADHRLPLSYKKLKPMISAKKAILLSVINDFDLFIIDNVSETFHEKGIDNLVEHLLKMKEKRSLSGKKGAYARWKEVADKADNSSPFYIDTETGEIVVGDIPF